jgi:riboflavin biosynthesis pyrimidine reductase
MGGLRPIAPREDAVNGMHWLRPMEAVDDPLAPYAAVLRAARGGRPYVLANMVGGLDGSAAVSGRVGELSSPADARLFTELRSVADVVLVGARTVREERYGPVRLPDRLRRERIEGGRPPTPRIAVVTRSLDFDWTIPLFGSADPESRPYVITVGAADPSRLAAAEEYAEVVVAGETTVDLSRALAGLRDGGAEVVLCEGGPTLLGALAAADHLDELCLSITPLMGGDPLPLSLAPTGAPIARFVLAHALVDDSDLFLRYERRIDA